MSEITQIKTVGDIKEIFSIIKSLRSELENVRDDVKELFGRVTVLERTSDKFDVKLDNIKQSLDKVILKLDELDPGKRWNSFVTVCISAIAGGVITYLLSMLFS